MTDVSTIAALATAPAPAGIAIIRVSGPNSKTVLNALFNSKQNPVDAPRMLVFGQLIDYQTKDVIDHALAVFMPNPFSFTGEDVVEFQFHGSPLLVQKVLRSLYAFGIKPAEAGEFTKRAFLNGKMDLAQAEAVADLINATSEQALKVAGEHLHGKFSKSLEELGEPLRNILAEVEAHIDFPDEDIEPETILQLKSAVEACQEKVSKLLQTYAYGHKVKEGFRVLLCGAPNAGKSSILNLLLGKERAIVTDISGTTRDLIEEEAILSNYRFIFCDSAGIRDTNDKVEKIGVELAIERIPWADLVVLVVDAGDAGNDWKSVLELLRAKSKRIWMVTNKIDLNPKAIGTIFCDSTICHQNFYISAKTGGGVDSFVNALVEEVKQGSPDTAETNQVITNERQRNCLENALKNCKKAVSNIDEKLPLEIISADVRAILRALHEIIGETYTEDILGRIFSRFCIGK